MKWRVNVPGMLHEIVENNPTTWIFRSPFNILMEILTELATRCSQLDDPKLNELMVRMALYEVANPGSKEFNLKEMERIISMGDDDPHKDSFVHGCDIPEQMRVLTIGDLLHRIACFDIDDQVVVEIHEGWRSEDLYPFYVDSIDGIQLVDENQNPTKKVREIRLCI